MTTTLVEKEIVAASQRELLTIRFNQIAPLDVVNPQKKASTKYKQIKLPCPKSSDTGQSGVVNAAPQRLTYRQ